MKRKKQKKIKGTSFNKDFFQGNIAKQSINVLLKERSDLLDGKIAVDNLIKTIDNTPESINRLLNDIEKAIAVSTLSEKKCTCIRCTEGEQAYQERIRESLQTFGWYTHCERHDCNSPTHFSARTFGLPDNFNHPDLQIVIPAQDKFTHIVFSNAIDKIKEGIKFKADDLTTYDDIIYNGYKVKFIPISNGTETLYRIIFPNKDHLYTDGIYSAQYL